MTEFKSLVSKYASTSTVDLMRAVKRARGDQTDDGDSSSSSSSAPGSQSTPMILDDDNDNGDNDDGSENDVQPTAKKMVKREEDSSIHRRSSSRVAATMSTSSRAITADSIKTSPHRQRSVRSMKTNSNISPTMVNGDLGVTEISDDEPVNTVKHEPVNTVKVETTVTVKTKSRGNGRTFTTSVNSYTPPEVYAHLDFVPDHIGHNLDVLFVGINPGVRTSERGHHYSGPGNHFWPCLNECGLLPPHIQLGPADDHTLPTRFQLGLTNLVDRPSRSGAELSNTEARAAAPILMAKIRKYRPRFVCFVSKQAWDMFAGVGLGLQTGFVSWEEEEEEEEEDKDKKDDDDDDDDEHDNDQAQFDRLIKDEDSRPSFKNKAVVKAKQERGVAPYQLSPFFTQGPALERLQEELRKEGVPVHFNVVKEEEDDKEAFKRVKKEEREEQDHKLAIKKEEADTPESSKAAARRRRRSRPVFQGSRMFVMPSTSGRVTQYRKEDKLAFFRQLTELVRQDRLDRGLPPTAGL
ncbi:hypothetical protein DFQ26_001565 [Actinomortierella ambigua]|nr:hypothetical protein DFQ26_001565 [Actinomortierella ambigua]